MYVSRLCECMYPGCVDICIQVVWIYVSRLSGCIQVTWMYPGYVDVFRLFRCVYPSIQVVLMYVYMFCECIYPGCVDVSRLRGCIQVVWMCVHVS